MTPNHTPSGNPGDPSCAGGERLLPCPFCGHAVVALWDYQHDHGVDWRAVCQGDDCGAEALGHTEEETRRMWNRRQPAIAAAEAMRERCAGVATRMEAQYLKRSRETDRHHMDAAVEASKATAAKVIAIMICALPVTGRRREH